MENNYSVAISCHSDLGYIEYTADTKSANIVLANEVAKQKVEEFLKYTINFTSTTWNIAWFYYNNY